MDSHGFLFQAFVYLFAGVLAVPVASRLGLGSVLGYLIAGIVIGPFVLGFIPPGEDDVQHFAEFGVVMMLFLIGLELKPALLWQMRGPILGLGGVQVLATTAVVCVLALACGLAWKAALTLGMIAAMSSTAIVLQSLNEKRLLKTEGGQACFSVLLFQDIAVIPMLALMPLLASGSGTAPADAHGHRIAAMPGWQQALLTLGAVAAIYFAGRFLLRHFFRFVAAARLREVFTATALLLIVGISLLMQSVGLSPALGAFLAGVVLAESEYRHQLETDIEPFKGLLLGVFFISVGASLDFVLIQRQPALIAGIVASLMAVKFLVLFCSGRAFRLAWPENFLFACALSQVGEFAFVLLAEALHQGVLTVTITGPLLAATAVSMALTPVLLIAHERLILPRFVRRAVERAADTIDEHDNPVVLAGFGRFGHVVGRLLRANGFGVTVLDHDADWVETIRKYGMQAYYGDASRVDLLRTAGTERARLFVCAAGDVEKSLQIVDLVREHFPQVKIFARAIDREHAYALIRRGVENVHRETLESALALGADALRALGVSARQAERAARLFHDLDEASVREMAHLQGDEAYASRALQHNENLERAFQADRAAALAEETVAPNPAPTKDAP